jgi:hypothetical protein
MKASEAAHGKLLIHGKGLGTVTRDMVVQRAREIAIINGREPNHYTRDDFLEAKRELTTEDADVYENGEDDPLNALTTWDEEPGSSGHEVDHTEPSDEQIVGERLIGEGLSEAEHDTMVEGAKRNGGGEE